MLGGILNLDKPPGLTSARAVSRVKHMLPRGTKIGHAGTLDPLATGVLLLLVGRATKSCEQLMGQRKGYDATVRLGACTATDDPEAALEPVEVLMPPDQQAVEAALGPFVGEILQRPPIYSALKVGGRRAYDLARKGKAVDLAPRRVMVYSIALVEYAWPLAMLRIECGRGTYIRSIARDLGDALETGGHLSQLRRTFIGRFAVEQSVALEQLTSETVAGHLQPIELG